MAIDPQGENPAAWSVLQHVLPRPGKTAPKEHHAAVPYAEVPALMAELRAHEGVSVRRCIPDLDRARTGEVLGATWDEIDLAGQGLDDSGRAHEGGQGTPRAAVRCRP